MLRTRLYSVYGVLLLLLIAGSVLSWCMPNAAKDMYQEAQTRQAQENEKN